MPLYEYQCESCGNRFEVIRKFSDGPVETCPKCGGHVQKLMSAPAFTFKGSGWYITDYAKKDSSAASSAKSDGSTGDGAKGEGTKGEGAKGEGSKGEGAKSEGKSGDAAKTDSAPAKTESSAPAKPSSKD
jgi:putative FmdB family regulatory protein